MSDSGIGPHAFLERGHLDHAGRPGVTWQGVRSSAGTAKQCSEKAAGGCSPKQKRPKIKRPNNRKGRAPLVWSAIILLEIGFSRHQTRTPWRRSAGGAILAYHHSESAEEPIGWTLRGRGAETPKQWGFRPDKELSGEGTPRRNESWGRRVMVSMGQLEAHPPACHPAQSLVQGQT